MILDTSPSSSPSPSPSYTERLAALRRELIKLELDGYLVPMTDIYQNEYVAPHDRRIRWLTGFTGTAGYVVVLKDKAAFFTDGRYTLQAKEQVSSELYELFDGMDKSPSQWLGEQIAPKAVIGFDPQLHTVLQVERLETSLLTKMASLVPVEPNLVNTLWTDRPTPKTEPFYALEERYTGKTSRLKRRELAEAMKKNNVAATLLTDPASVAWLLNVRGSDVPYTPLPCSTAILHDDGRVDWFVEEAKGSPELDATLGSEVTRHAPEAIGPLLQKLGEAKKRVQIDPAESSYALMLPLRQAGAELHRADDPCALPRACKNATETQGMIAAHERDGVAMVRFLCWLDENLPSGTLSELKVEEKLNALRAEGALHRGPSFSTIAGSGPHGAIVHYRATQASDRTLDQGSFLLLDSGAQYLDGTTDITRTIPLGEVTDEMRTLFTLVLKGHIALARARFPEGTSGAELDTLARQYLWQRGLDYSHGTGHGVGSYLGVHEGPQNISRRGMTPLCVGMVTSNEPGYYKADAFGIRIENLQRVIELPDISGPERKMLGFESLTLAPFDRRAMALGLLCAEEKEWLNTYHTRVRDVLTPHLDNKTAQWLEAATAPLL